MVLGGTGSLLGAVWGAILVVYIPTWSTSLSQSLHISDSQASNVALVMYGAALILVIILAPSGIQGLIRRIAGLSTSFIRRSVSRSSASA
jgi:branched-chain amino acid transport system permease protein